MSTPAVNTLESRDAELETILTSFDSNYVWNYGSVKEGLRDLYEKSKREQWNGTTQLDWGTEVDPEGEIIPSAVNPLAGYGPYEKLDEKERAHLRHGQVSLQLSQFLHGEQGALIVASQLVGGVPWIDAKYYAGTQTMDEARHVEVFSRYVHEKLEWEWPINDSLKELLDATIQDSRWDFKYLGMQVLIEGLAMAAFGNLFQICQEPLLKDLLRYVMRDESRHVAFGVLSLRDYYTDMPENELRDREDFIIYASELMRDRLIGSELARAMGWPADEVKEVVLNSPVGQAFRSMLFQRVTPNLKKLGLLTPRVREAYQRMNLLQFEDFDADAADRELGFLGMKALPRLEYSGAVDGDGHVLEPPDMWERYIDPADRDVAMAIRKDHAGLEYLDLGRGRASKIIRKGYPAGLGLMDRLGGIVLEREPKTGSPYLDTAPLGSMDPKERLQRIDMENIERVFLYPTLSILWVSEVEDEAVIRPNLRAYNRFIVDFCADSDGRLLPVAQLSLGDVKGAVAELRRVAAEGVKGVWVAPFTTTRLPLGDPAHDEFFAACQELGIALGIHPVFEPKWCAPGRFGEYTSAKYGFFHNATAGDAVRHAFTSLFQYGVFARFPELRVVVLETGAGWIGYWLDRMDTIHGTIQGRQVREIAPEPPSEYFKRQCWIAGDPDEKSLVGVIPIVGEDRFFWASDFPHPDHPPEYVPEVARLVAALPESARAGFLGRNVLDAYGIE